MKTQAALLALTCLAVSPVWAVNKCTGADGAVVFQDAPCAGKGEALTVRPASGVAKEKAAAAVEPGTKKTDVQRIEEQVAASQKERRLRDLEQREVPSAEQAIRAHLQACKDEQERLERSKGEYVQNFYGKTDAAQKASEQAAAAARCDTKDRELRLRHEALRSECLRLSGCR